MKTVILTTEEKLLYNACIEAAKISASGYEFYICDICLGMNIYVLRKHLVKLTKKGC